MLTDKRMIRWISGHKTLDKITNEMKVEYKGEITIEDARSKT